MAQGSHEADVVIVGTGGAALSAAVAALDSGASVLLLEAAAEPGGTTRISGGGFWIPNNSLMRAQGLTDQRPDALQYMARLSYPAVYDAQSPTLGLTALQYELLAAFYDQGATVIDTLIQLGALDPMILPSLGFSANPISDPDYHSELPENKAPFGRVLTAKVPPGVMAWPGMFLADGMLDHVRRQGVPILTQHRVTDALTNQQGEVIGVVAEYEKTRVQIYARRAVVFASGGFAHDTAKAQAYLRGPIFGSGSVPTSTGAFLDIAMRLGAGIDNLTSAFFYQAALEELVATGGAVRNPLAHTFFPYGDSTILVNRYGERCVNEKSPYHVRTQSHFQVRGAEHPNLIQIMIYDAAVAQDPTFWPWRGSVPLPNQPSDFVIMGTTLEELAENIDTRLTRLRGARGLSAGVGAIQLTPDFVATLRATIDRFNGFATSGKDLDFQRGETPIEQAWQGPSRSTTGNRTMYPLSTRGPYYAILLGAATLDTCGGPLIDADARVLRRDGAVIPGLFAAGNCVASPAGQAYWGAGGTLGPALVFGYIAGRNAAKQTRVAPPRSA
jgi:glycine/D-amino acid oxidase-like deaminating enzyme